MRLKIKNIFAALLVVSALSSCEDALDKFPLDSLSPETFFSTESELQAYANTFYTMFPGTSLYNEQSDIITNHQLADYMLGLRDINSGSWSWTNLRKVNTLIEYSVNCKDEAVRTKYVALARFFRAYFYFEKVKMFGDVPWADRPLGSGDAELYKARDNREFVMGKIIEDIDFAIENLQAIKSDYTVTKWTALALKSRICLFEGTFRKYHAGSVYLETLPADAQPYTYYLELAAEAADQFITSSGYKIYNAEGKDASYLGLFTKTSINEGSNAEVILARNYSLAYGVTHSAGNYITSGTMGRPGMTKKFVNSYLMKDGSRFTDQPGYETMNFVQETKNRDPRFAQSVRTPGYKRPGTDVRLSPELTCCCTGYSPIKYLQSEANDRYNECELDLIIFRAAEVYLNYAEAKAELGDLKPADVDKSIKPIRERVGMPNLDVNTITVDSYLAGTGAFAGKNTGYPNVIAKNGSFSDKQIAAILEVRRERTIELVMEGHRYYDIIRWGEGATLSTPLQGIYFDGPGNHDLDGDGVVDVTLYEEGQEVPAGAALIKYVLEKEFKLSEGTKGYYEHHRDNRNNFTWNEGRDYLYPIPVDERSLTNGALTQNPGWDDGLSF